MLRRSLLLMVASAVCGALSCDNARAAESSGNETVVTIQGEMCGGCVKKLQGALVKLPGIARVDGNAAEKTITIVPAAQTTLSPKLIWETVEGTGKKPAKLVGPNGEFVAKPGE